MLILLLLGLFLLTIASVLLFTNFFMPDVLQKAERWQRRRVMLMLPKLDKLWVDLPTHHLFLIINIIFPAVLGIIGLALTKNALGGLFGGVLGLVLPFVAVKQIEKRRKKKFAGQLVDAIMLLSSSLKAGLSLLQALEVLVEEMPPPISQEFGLVVRENKMGVALNESLATLNKRMNLDDLELLANSILIARETGGDLTKVLSRLATTIRDKHKLMEHIATLTLQGRLQGLIMSVLPFFFVWWVMTFNKHHFDIMFQTDNGRALMIIAIVLQTVGVILIRKFSKLDF